MKKHYCLLFCLITFSFYSCKKDNTEVTPSGYVELNLSTAFSTRLNIVFDSTCNALQLKGASAAVVVPGVGLWKRAYSESHAGAPISTEMIFTIGSNTKTFIAAAYSKASGKTVVEYKRYYWKMAS